MNPAAARQSTLADASVRKAKAPSTKQRAAVAHPVLSAESLLGGKPVLHKRLVTPMDWVSAIREGMPSAAVDALAASIRVTQFEFSAALGIPERTLVRRKKEGVLSSEESAKLVRVARVVERAEAVFGDFDVALDWLKSANASLSGVTPLSLLDTEIGAESVMDTLGRIEHGVFA
jgi:putative toxin-antitoxin system antitoxin component (TIGR02293 family)